MHAIVLQTCKNLIQYSTLEIQFSTFINLMTTFLLSQIVVISIDMMVNVKGHAAVRLVKMSEEGGVRLECENLLKVPSKFQEKWIYSGILPTYLSRLGLHPTTNWPLKTNRHQPILLS